MLSNYRIYGTMSNNWFPFFFFFLPLIKGDLSLEYEPLFLLFSCLYFSALTRIVNTVVEDNECISINTHKGFLGGSDAQPDLESTVGASSSPLWGSLSQQDRYSGLGMVPGFRLESLAGRALSCTVPRSDLGPMLCGQVAWF